MLLGSLGPIGAFFSSAMGRCDGFLDSLFASFGFGCVVDASENKILLARREGFEILRGTFRPQSAEQVFGIGDVGPVQDRDSHAHPIASFGFCFFANLGLDADIVLPAADGKQAHFEGL